MCVWTVDWILNVAGLARPARNVFLSPSFSFFTSFFAWFVAHQPREKENVIYFHALCFCVPDLSISRRHGSMYVSQTRTEQVSRCILGAEPHVMPCVLCQGECDTVRKMHFLSGAMVGCWLCVCAHIIVHMPPQGKNKKTHTERDARDRWMFGQWDAETARMGCLDKDCSAPWCIWHC